MYYFLLIIVIILLKKIIIINLRDEANSYKKIISFLSIHYVHYRNFSYCIFYYNFQCNNKKKKFSKA